VAHDSSDDYPGGVCSKSTLIPLILFAGIVTYQVYPISCYFKDDRHRLMSIEEARMRCAHTSWYEVEHTGYQLLVCGHQFNSRALYLYL
jgi:hypothetical protein